jgi:hypothetical protein
MVYGHSHNSNLYTVHCLMLINWCFRGWTCPSQANRERGEYTLVGPILPEDRGWPSLKYCGFFCLPSLSWHMGKSVVHTYTFDFKTAKYGNSISSTEDASIF